MINVVNIFPAEVWPLSFALCPKGRGGAPEPVYKTMYFQYTHLVFFLNMDYKQTIAELLNDFESIATKPLSQALYHEFRLKFETYLNERPSNDHFEDCTRQNYVCRCHYYTQIYPAVLINDIIKTYYQIALRCYGGQ